MSRPKAKSSPLPENLLLALSEAESLENLASSFEGAAEHLGFPDGSLAAIILEGSHARLKVLRHSDRVIEFDRSIHLGPPGPDMWRHDPVTRRMRYGPGIPFVWDHATYKAAGRLDDYERHEALGFGNGLALRLVMPTSAITRPVHFCVNVQRSEAIRPNNRDRLMADLALISLHAQVGAGRLIMPRMLEICRGSSPLTPSMREYLAWAERGKTIQETAQILGRSCSTVNNSVAEAIFRLEASNKRHAVEICRIKGWL